MDYRALTSEGWLPDTSLSLENNFQLNAPVVIRAKVILAKLISKLKLVIRQPSPSFMQPHAWNVWFTKNFIPDLTEHTSVDCSNECNLTLS